MRRQTSIKKRVRAVFLFTSVIAVLITSTAFAFSAILGFKTQLVRNLSTLAAVIADNSAVPLAFESKATAADILSALKAEPDIVAAAVYALDGTLFAKYPATLPADRLPARPEMAERGFADSSFVLVEWVMHEGKPIGSLYLRSSLAGLYTRLWRYAGIVVAVIAGAVLVAFLLATLLQKRVTDPILALTDAAQTITERGDYSVRAPKLTEDELGTLTDAFNRMLAETQEHQGRLKEQARLLNLTFDAILVRDAQDKISYWNRGAEQLYGFTREEALGQPPDELLRTEFPEPRERIFEKLHRDNDRWLGELVHTRKNGNKIHVASRWTLDRSAPGKAVSILEINTDITERKAFQTELERLVAERTAKLRETIGELEAFSYSISHDMRAPLRAMHGYAKALMEDYNERLDAQGRQFLERISRAAVRLDSLIQDVLAYSRVAKGDIQLQPVNLNRLIDDILANHPELQPPRANIIVQKPLHPVLGHEAYLTQCISNLVGNAVKFVPEGKVPEVRIRTEHRNGRVRLWFEDNGIGIDPSHYERIFQIFGQVYAEKKYGGTGIGLAIVRKAAQRMNGEVGVESTLGQGSRFWIILQEATV